MSDAIKVTTEVEVVWYELGQQLAGEFDYDQAAFLDGLAAGLHALRGDSGAQILNITDKTHGYTKWLIEELHGFYQLKD